MTPTLALAASLVTARPSRQLLAALDLGIGLAAGSASAA
jgi:hypothetical protein